MKTKELLKLYERVLYVLNKYVKKSIKWDVCEINTLNYQKNNEKVIDIIIKLSKFNAIIDKNNITTLINTREIELLQVNTDEGLESVENFIKQTKNKINYINNIN